MKKKIQIHPQKIAKNWINSLRIDGGMITTEGKLNSRLLKKLKDNPFISEENYKRLKKRLQDIVNG